MPDSPREERQPLDIINKFQNEQAATSTSRITEWQSKIDVIVPESDISLVLYTACVKTFVTVFRTLRLSSSGIEPSLLDCLQEEFRKLYVWNDTVPTTHGDLGTILATSRNLKSIVLGLMVQWTQALCRSMFIWILENPGNQSSPVTQLST